MMQIPTFSENRNNMLAGTELQCETGKRMQPGAAATMWDCLRTGVIVPSEDGVLYWFPLGVQSVIQGKVHGGKRGAVQGLTFQHPFLVISDLIINSILSNIYQEVLVPECNTVEVRFGQNKLCSSLSRRWSARPGRRRSARCWRSSSARGSMRASASRCLNKSAQMSLTQCAILYR